MNTSQIIAQAIVVPTSDTTNTTALIELRPIPLVAAYRSGPGPQAHSLTQTCRAPAPPGSPGPAPGGAGPASTFPRKQENPRFGPARQSLQLNAEFSWGHAMRPGSPAYAMWSWAVQVELAQRQDFVPSGHRSGRRFRPSPCSTTTVFLVTPVAGAWHESMVLEMPGRAASGQAEHPDSKRFIRDHHAGATIPPRLHGRSRARCAEASCRCCPWR